MILNGLNGRALSDKQFPIPQMVVVNFEFVLYVRGALGVAIEIDRQFPEGKEEIGFS